MSVFQDYNKKREKLLEQMQTLQEFEQSDEIVGLVFVIARQLVEQKSLNNIEWLLKKGMELANYAGVLDGRANVAWGQYKTAEMAFKSVRDALMLANKSEHNTVTTAKAQASRSTEDAEVDALAREQRSKNYATAADMCNRIVMFIQTTIRWSEQELAKERLKESGQR